MSNGLTAIPGNPSAYVASRCAALGLDHSRLLEGRSTPRYKAIRTRLAWSLREIYRDLSLPDIAGLVGCAHHARVLEAIRLTDIEVFGRGMAPGQRRDRRAAA